MTEDSQVEILAQAMWRGAFGETRLLPDWQRFANENTSMADDIRGIANDMLQMHATLSKTKTSNDYTGLDWLFQ